MSCDTSYQNPKYCVDPKKISLTHAFRDETSECEHPEELFTSLQYSFFTNSGVEVLGGILFLASAIFIVRDRLACEKAEKAAENA